MARERLPRGGPRLRNFNTPDDLRDETLDDAFSDAFTAPDDLVMMQPDNGFMALIRDGRRIRDDFRKIMG